MFVKRMGVSRSVPPDRLIIELGLLSVLPTEREGVLARMESIIAR